MLAYLFWHRPLPDIERETYERGLVAFHQALAKKTGGGFRGSACYRLSPTPWLDEGEGYEDWYLVESSAALDALNEIAVAPDLWDVHAGVSYKTDKGHGGLYRFLSGDADPRAASRTAWLTRPKRIRYQDPLAGILEAAGGSLGVWRKQLVFGPAPEFALLGGASFTLDLPSGWSARYVDRTALFLGESTL